MHAEQRGRGSGGPAPEILNNLDCKWGNQSYSGALFVHKGGLGTHNGNLKKKLDQMVQSELLWSFICENKGALGDRPPEIFKKLDCKWCNQSYSGASFVNKGGPEGEPRK